MAYFCPRFHSIACSVNLYCWRGWLGVSGYLHSIAASSKAGRMYSFLNLVLFFTLKCSIISTNDVYLSVITPMSSLTWYELGTNLGPT